MPALSAFASQGSETSSGTATDLEQSVLIGAIIVVACIGFAFKLRHR
jgi:hypothetical protein